MSAHTGSNLTASGRRRITGVRPDALRDHGLEWVHPAACAAYPLPDASARLEGKRVLITGATSGIGLAAVERFAWAVVRVIRSGHELLRSVPEQEITETPPARTAAREQVRPS